MDEKKTAFRRIFSAGFKETAQWSDWFFDNVYDDENAMIGYASGQAVSCLMLDRYKLKIGSATTNIGYISCATTIRSARGQGNMRRLLSDAIMEAASRGDSIVTLLPASERLYFYYDRMNFSTVFYADELRYTSLHAFERAPELEAGTPTFEGFHKLELAQRCRVMHNEHDFNNILADNALDGGEAIALTEPESGDTRAILFAVPGSDAVRVKDIMASDERSAESLLAVLRERIGERMIVVDACPSDSPAMLKSRGMGRIVNVGLLLKSLVSNSPATEQVIRVHDRLISDNDAIFIIHNGHVERTSSTMRRITLDTSIDTLAKIIFNSRRTGEIFGLPSFRPDMKLMLE